MNVLCIVLVFQFFYNYVKKMISPVFIYVRFTIIMKLLRARD